MNLHQLHAALEHFAHAPAAAARRIQSPQAVQRVSRLPINWVPPPKPERLTFVSLAIANWLNRRGPKPPRDAFDDAPLLMADGTTTFINDPRFQTELGQHVDVEARPRALARLIDVYFRSDAAVANIIGSLIARNVARHRDTAEFAQPATRGLFDPGGLAKRLATRSLEMGGDFDRALRELGSEFNALDCPLSHRACKALPGELIKALIGEPRFHPESVARSIEQLERRHASALPTGRATFVHNILHDSRTTRTPDEHRHVGAVALALLGSPFEEAGAWTSFDSNVQRSVASWLPRKAIELALQLTRDTDELQKWKEKFWLGLVDQGVVEQATLIVVGPLLESLTEGATSPGLSTVVATAQRNSIYSMTILIMRAGPMTIAEWAPSGSCRIWRERNRSKPQLAQATYDVWQLRQNADYEQVHRGSPKGVWQSEMINYLQKAGVVIPDPGRLL